MQKILVTLNAVDPDEKTLDFACFLGRLTKSRVVGVFLENKSSNQKRIKKSQVERNFECFKQACINREVNFDIRVGTGRPAKEMVTESRFADLIVTGPETSFSRDYEGRPTEFVKEILKKAECPVIIAPESFDAIEEIVFTYDGSASSVFAIKQFTYLFPQLNNRKVTVVHMDKTGEWGNAEINEFSEWLKAHYADLHFETKKGDSDTGLFEWLFMKKNTFIVMGSYGRNALSLFFKHSHADLPIHILSQPIFITHL